MAETTRTARGLAAVLTTAALAGCATTHVGEDWQCPFAQGDVCTSIAAADPAVTTAPRTAPDTDRTPLYAMVDSPDAGDAHGSATGEAPAPSAPPATEHEAPDRTLMASETQHPADAAKTAPESTRGCVLGCRPLAWLARLLERDRSDATQAKPHAHDDAEATPGDGASTDAAAAGELDSGTPEPDRSAAASVNAGTGDAVAIAKTDPRPSDSGRPATETHASAPVGAAESDAPPAATLRRAEVIGRVWIAPFVDAQGLYREASWVRVVLMPAGWRRP